MSEPKRKGRTGSQLSDDAAVPARRRPPPQMTVPGPGDEAPTPSPHTPSKSGRSGKSTSGAYDVGYCKPPRSTQFKPGKSGNPKGRPKEARSLKTIAQREFMQFVEIRDGDGTRKITRREALIKSLMVKALKGEFNAIRTLITISGEDSEPEESLIQEQALSPSDEAMLRRVLGDAPGEVDCPRSATRKDGRDEQC